MVKFLIGVNYWPRKKAMYWWKEFEEDEVRSEFKKIRDLSVDIIRFFLLWEDFQPTPWKVNKETLIKLETVLNIADKYRLKTIPTLFVGHMSGVNWAPKWLLDKSSSSVYPVISGGKVTPYGVKDIYRDQDVLKAEIFLIKTIVSAFKEHPAIYAWDISNEIDNLKIPDSPQIAKNWCNVIFSEIKRLDPQHPVTLGLHQENLEFDKGFHIQDLPFDLVSMHGYSILAPWAEDPLDSDVVPFLNVLTEHLAGKPVIFQEFGIPTAPSGSPERILNKVLIFKKEVTLVLASEDEAATYYKEVLEKLYLVGSLGAVAWCFSDYDPSIWNRFPLDKNVIERFMGIVRSDGNLKYAGKVLHEFALQRKKVVSCPIKLNILRENYYNNPLKNLKEAFKEFKKKIREITFI